MCYRFICGLFIYEYVAPRQLINLHYNLNIDNNTMILKNMDKLLNRANLDENKYTVYNLEDWMLLNDSIRDEQSEFVSDIYIYIYTLGVKEFINLDCININLHRTITITLLLLCGKDIN